MSEPGTPPGLPEPEPERHDPTGLGLASDIAHALGAQTRRRRRRTEPRRRTDPQVSGSRPDDRDPKLLSAAVERLVEAKGWSTDINVRTLLARWGLLVGSSVAEHSPTCLSSIVISFSTTY